MLGFRRFYLGLLASVLFLPSSWAEADWTGLLTVSATLKGKKIRLDGKLGMKAAKTRVDFENPFRLSTIFDSRSRKNVVIVHGSKAYSESAGSSAQSGQSGAHFCGTGDIERCLEKNGFRKVDSESVGGIPCRVYKGALGSPKGEYQIMLWRPGSQALREVPWIRQRMLTPEGYLVESSVTNVVDSKLDDAYFQPPKGYAALRAPGR